MWLVNALSSINFLEVGEVGYLLGLLNGGAISFLVFAANRALALRPEPLYHHTLKVVTSDPQVIARLGTPLKSGPFRLHAPIRSKWRFQAEKGVDYMGWERYWTPRKMQLLFSLMGSKHSGIVTAEVKNVGIDRPVITVLAVDVLDDSGDRLVLVGDPKKSIPYEQLNIK